MNAFQKQFQEKIKAIVPGSKEYWKMRCEFLEKFHDPTYQQGERDNCYWAWRKLVSILK